MKNTKHFVKVTVPGFIVPETFSVEVPSRDIKDLPVNRIAGGYGLRFYDVLETTVMDGTEEIKATTEPLNYSVGYQIGTLLCTRDEFEKETLAKKDTLQPDQVTKRMKLIQEMKAKNINCALKAPYDYGFVAMKAGDSYIVIDEENTKVVSTGTIE